MEREARTEEPSPGFGDSKDAGLVLTVCGEDSAPPPSGAAGTHLKKTPLDPH